MPKSASEGTSAQSRYYLVELTQPDGGWEQLAELTDRVRAAAGRMRSSGNDVRFVRSVYAPESDSVFLVYRAMTEESVIAAAADAGLARTRVSVGISTVDGGTPMR